jgi:membrane-bound ClpP family serine protease
VEVVVQVVGALLVLLAFVLTQANRLSTTSRTYLLLNLFGAGVLAVDAALNAQLGFLLLEGVWAVVAGFGLLRSMQTGIGSG